MSSPDLPPKRLTDHKFLIFDVYGTLIDWESGIHTALQPLLSRFTSSAQWSRRDVIEKALEKELKTYSNQVVEPGPSTTQNESSDMSTSFAHSIRYWSPFPDSSTALHTLAKHFKLIVLSNVDHTSFADSHAYLSEGLFPTPSDSEPSAPTPNNRYALYTRSTANPDTLWLPGTTPSSKSPFSLIMTAQDVGAYKPSLDGFNTVFKHLATRPELHHSTSELLQMKEEEAKERVKAATLIVAQSLNHDHVPAKKMGVGSVWIDREGAKMRPGDGEDQEKWGWKWRFTTLSEMAEAVELEVAEGKGDGNQEVGNGSRTV